MTEPMFDMEPTTPDVPDGLSADRRRTLRQRQLIDLGLHPLTRSRVHDDPTLTCGNCRHRQVLDWHNRGYPKCLSPFAPAPTHGSATDVRAWWPACTNHELGEPRMSPDAARWKP